MHKSGTVSVVDNCKPVEILYTALSLVWQCQMHTLELHNGIVCFEMHSDTLLKCVPLEITSKLRVLQSMS